MKRFAQQLRYERKLHSWSQEQLAEMIGVSALTLRRWEREITLPSIYCRQKLSELFGKTAQELGLLEPDQELEWSAVSGGAAEHPSSAALGAAELFWNLPRQRNPLFTGREAMLARLHRILHRSDVSVQTPVLAISGLGGIGKTTLALEYAYRYSDSYQHIFWVQGEGYERLLADLAVLARALLIPEQQPQTLQPAIEVVKRWFEQHQEWLLIVDNLDDPALLHKIIPSRRTGHILVTTRSQFTGPFVQRLDLDTLDPEEGALFLLRRAKHIGPEDTLEQALPAERSLARDIVQRLDGLPLALDQAGAYIEESACSLPHYLQLLHSQRAVLLGVRHLAQEQTIDHPQSVWATLTLSFEQIAQVNPGALELLRLCAFLHPDAIPEDMLAQGVPDLSPLFQEQARASATLTYDAMIAALRRYSLIQRNSETQTLTIHRLVQAVLKDAMDDTQKCQWAQRAVHVVNRAFPLVDLWVTSSLCQRYVAQAQVCAAHIEEWDIGSLEAGRLLTELARYMYELSQYEIMGYAQVKRLLERSLAIFAHLAETGVLAAKTHLFLGWVSMALGQYTQAMTCSQQAWTILRKLLPSDHYPISEDHFDLAKIENTDERYQVTELLYKKALAIVEHHRGPEHPHVALNLANLGGYYCNQERYNEAEPLLLRALEISQKALGREHPLTAYILQELGRLYLEQGHYAQAEQFLLQAIEIRQQVLKPGHQDIAFSFKELGRLYLEQGQHAQAEALLLQALEISQKTMGAEHSQTAPLLNNLIGLCRAKGAAREAEALFLRALRIDQKTLESERSRIMFTYSLLAFLASLILTAGAPPEH